jgi:hypothetical protein
MTRILRRNLFVLIFSLKFANHSTVWSVEHCTALFASLWRTTQGYYALLPYAFLSGGFDVNSVAIYPFITDGWLKPTYSRENWCSFPRWIDLMNSFSSYQNGVVWMLVGVIDISLTETQLATISLIFSLLRVFLRGELSIQSSPWHRSVPFRTFWSYFIIFMVPWLNLSNLSPLHVIRLSTRRFWFLFYHFCVIDKGLDARQHLGRLRWDLQLCAEGSDMLSLIDLL